MSIIFKEAITIIASLSPFLTYIGKKMKEINDQYKTQNEKQNISFIVLAKAINHGENIDMKELRNYLFDDKDIDESKFYK